MSGGNSRKTRPVEQMHRENRLTGIAIENADAEIRSGARNSRRSHHCAHVT
jgi:hypothetical protein